jgi:hypothetical protein
MVSYVNLPYPMMELEYHTSNNKFIELTRLFATSKPSPNSYSNVAFK